jgi:phosphatidylserine/phosphatidylglycerophosphate/cardiolipin synthase-like enzyme
VKIGGTLLALHEKTLTVGVLIGVVLGVVCGYAVTSVLSLASLSEQINGLQDELDRFQISINERDADIAVLTAQISDKDNQISALQSQILSLKQQLESSAGVLGVRFSPDGGCEDQVLYWIGRANVSIHVLIYSFTLDSIGDALIQAQNRGVEVQVVFEKGQISQYSEYQRLKAVGILVRNDTNSHYMHDKIIIIDGVIVLTGSYNYSANAESYNNENLIVVGSTSIAEIYEEEFAKIWNESQQ